MDYLIEAVNRTTAVLKLSRDYRILYANQYFLDLTGFGGDELLSRELRSLLALAGLESEDLARLWADLSSATSIARQLLIRGKNDQEIWLQASLSNFGNDHDGEEAILVLGTDITKLKEEALLYSSLEYALRSSVATIEFDPDGYILDANQAFLDTMGYTLQEVLGQHHRIFAEKEYAGSPAYKSFWDDLKRGVFNRGRYKRISKSGDPVWLEASYSPVLDSAGAVTKIIKFAYDVTTTVAQGEALEAAIAEAREAEILREQMDHTIQEMSTPVTPIWEGILLLPLVGILDSVRASTIMTKSLTAISETRAKVFMLDISGVPAVDTAVGNQIIKITKATQLMGCETIISGLSPTVAQTIVDLGIDIGEIRTTSALRDAFQEALKIIDQASAVQSGVEQLLKTPPPQPL